MSHVLNLLFLLLLAAPSIISRRINPCLYNREDILPCEDYYNASVVSPGANQYTIHATRFQRDPATGGPVCVKRKNGEQVRDVEDLGRPEVKFIFSPGAEHSRPAGYVNQMLVEYNIVCDAGQQAFIRFEALHLEPRNCVQRCRDYVEIDTGSGGRLEFCGSITPSDPILVETGRFTLKLRTSFYSSYPGFRIFVTCFSNADPCRQKRRAPMVDRPLEEFWEPVDITTPRPVTLWTQMTGNERRRLNEMVEDLYENALLNARLKTTSWPPSSYSQNEPNDIHRLSELSLPPPPTRAPIRDPGPPPTRAPIRDPGPIDTDGPPPDRKRKSVHASDSQVRMHFSTAAIEGAVLTENCCNPILRAVSSSVTALLQRSNPLRLKTARIRLQPQLQPTVSPDLEELV